MILVIWTCKNREEAKRISHELLERRLIACASIVPQVLSLFHWEGKIDEAEECKVFLKSKKERFSEICDTIRKHCSYEVPEILEIEIKQGNPSYLEWVKKEVK